VAGPSGGGGGNGGGGSGRKVNKGKGVAGWKRKRGNDNDGAVLDPASKKFERIYHALVQGALSLNVTTRALTALGTQL
jgi:hypothetical protein